MDGIAGVLQHLGDQGGGSGLAVAAGDGNDLTGADLEEDFHFGGQNTALFHGSQERRDIRANTGRAEDDVLIQTVQIGLTQMELCPQAF